MQRIILELDVNVMVMLLGPIGGYSVEIINYPLERIYGPTLAPDPVREIFLPEKNPDALIGREGGKKRGLGLTGKHSDNIGRSRMRSYLMRPYKK